MSSYYEQFFVQLYAQYDTSAVFHRKYTVKKRKLKTALQLTPKKQLKLVAKENIYNALTKDVLRMSVTYPSSFWP